MSLTPDDTFYISDIETLELLADQRRLQLLEIISEQPRTLAELATLMQIAPQQLEPELVLLVAHGLVVEEADPAASGLRYAAAASRYIIDERLQPLDNLAVTEAVLQLAMQALEYTGFELLHNAAGLLADGSQDEERAAFGRARLFLTRSEARELAQELNSLWERYGRQEAGPNTDAYALLTVFFPTPNRLPPDA